MTGAARRIGAAIARHLADEGWRVAVHYHEHAEEALALAAALPGAVALPGDLADPATPAALVAAARQVFGAPLVGLVNNASLFRFDAPPRIDAALLAEHHAVNLAAPALLASALALQDDLVAGAVVNLLDQKLFNLNPDFLTYTLSKIGLQGLTTLLAQSFAPRVRVAGIAPGLTLRSGSQTDARFAEQHAANPLGVGVETDDLVRALRFILATPSFTGDTLIVDSGEHLTGRPRDIAFDRKKN